MEEDGEGEEESRGKKGKGKGKWKGEEPALALALVNLILRSSPLGRPGGQSPPHPPIPQLHPLLLDVKAGLPPYPRNPSSRDDTKGQTETVVVQKGKEGDGYARLRGGGFGGGFGGVARFVIDHDHESRGATVGPRPHPVA